MRYSAAFLLLLTAGAAPLLAQSRMMEMEAVSDQGKVDSTTQTEDVAFKDDKYERMTVPVRLSGTGPYRFLVDTGADRTAISRQLAAKLNLNERSEATLHSVTGVSTVTTATVPNLQLTRKNLKVANAPLLDSANMGADGILGVDSLRSQRVLFDFEGQTISIVPSAERELKGEPGAIVVQARRKNGHLILTEAKANGRRVSVVVDTGSQYSIGNSALRRQLLGSRQLTSMRQVELESVTGGKLVGDMMFIRDVEIGGIQLKELAVVFADSHAFRKLGLDKKPSLLLGMNAMRAFKKVSIDFANKKLRIVLPQESAIDARMAEAKPTRLP